MPVVHHFAHGAVNPVAAYVLAFLGALLGLHCTVRARAARTRGRRYRWLAIASFAIGGGIWLMHFMAVLGFDVPASPVRYDPVLTGASAAIAVLVVGVGLFVAGAGRRTLAKLLVGGGFTGIGIAAMHFTGMAAVRVQGALGYRTGLAAATLAVALVAGTVAVRLSTTVRGTATILASAALIALLVTGMHYTGMAAVRVRLSDGAAPVPGIEPIALLLPIVVATTAALIGLVFSALQTATAEDFSAPDRSAAYRAVPFHTFAGKAPVPRSDAVPSHR